MYLDEPYEIPRYSPAKSEKKVIEAIVGQYKFGPDFYRPNGSVRIFERDGNLYARSGGLLALTNDWSFIYRAYWSSLTFVRNDNGEVTHLLFDSYKGIKKK